MGLFAIFGSKQAQDQEQAVEEIQGVQIPAVTYDDVGNQVKPAMFAVRKPDRFKIVSENESVVSLEAESGAQFTMSLEEFLAKFDRE